MIRKLGDLQEGEEFTTTLTERLGYVVRVAELNGGDYLPSPGALAGNVRVVFEDGEVRTVRAELLVRVD